MKKIFTLVACVAASLSLFASETVVWSGDTAISWNQDVYVGVQFETALDLFAGLAKDDTIKVTVVAHIDEPQYVITYKAGDNWTWTDIEGLEPVDGIISYIVPDETMANEIATRGLVFRGQGYNITQISIASEDQEPEQPLILVEGETTTLWENAEGVEMAWNEICEQGAELGAQLAEKDKIIVTVSAKNPDTEWPKVILRDASSEEVTNELLNEISTFPHDVVFTLTAAQATAVQEGFRISGDGVTVTKVAAYKYKEGDEPEPQPVDTIDYTGLVETVVYAPASPIAISWDESAYAGIKIDTRDISETMFAGLQEEYIIRVSVVDVEENAEFSLQYKAGDDWTWTDLALNTATEGYIAYKVESDEMAMLIADRGLVIQGIRYKVSQISVFGAEALPDPQGIGEVESQHSQSKSKKILLDGQLYILRDGVTYTMQGQLIRHKTN